MKKPLMMLLLISLMASPLIALHAAEPIAAFTPGARILFQGDSITDGNRGRSADPNHILGHGYVFIIAAKYGAAFPDLKLDFLNRGVSGNTVLDLEKRWQKDTLDLKPDVLSILIGVNDERQGRSAGSVRTGLRQAHHPGQGGEPQAQAGALRPVREAHGQDQRGHPQAAGDRRQARPEARRGPGAVPAGLRRGGETRPGRLLDLGQRASDLSRPPAHGRRVGAGGPRVLEMNGGLSLLSGTAAR